MKYIIKVKKNPSVSVVTMIRIFSYLEIALTTLIIFQLVSRLKIICELNIP